VSLLVIVAFGALLFTLVRFLWRWSQPERGQPRPAH
jgi:hypothetical protein